MYRTQIAALLDSRRVEDRIRGVGLTDRLPDETRRELLLRALGDKTNYVAAEAAKLLGDCADEAADIAMVERFLWLAEKGETRDVGCHIRANLAFAFGKRECHRASDALRIGVQTVQIEAVGGVPFDVGAHLRANSALALAQMRARDALRDIGPLLFDFGRNRIGARSTTPLIRGETRKAAAQALGILGNRDALALLASKLLFPEADELPEVLQECMQSVVMLQDERGLELLTPYLTRHPDELLAAYAGLMIAQSRAPEAPALLRDALPRFSGDALEAVLIALTTLRTPKAEQILEELSSDGSRAVRRILEQVWQREKRDAET
jgi:HEAT repeat protein